MVFYVLLRLIVASEVAHHIITLKRCIYFVFVLFAESTILVLRALPNDDSEITSKKEVQNVFRFIRDFESEAFADDHMPVDAELLVHRLLDHSSGQLRV